MDSHTVASIRSRLLHAIYISTLLVAIGLIVYISFDTLEFVSMQAGARFLRVQFWCCIFFQFGALGEYLLTPKTLRSALRLVLALLVCLPYLPAIYYFGVDVTPTLQYLLRFVPLIRGVVVLAFVLGAMSSDWVQSTFRVYLIFTVSLLYVLSLLLFVEEYHVNPQISTFWDALWYAVMQMTTTGSEINPVTPAGKAIGVILSADGLILFPIFTVYLTRAFGRRRQHSQI